MTSMIFRKNAGSVDPRQIWFQGMFPQRKKKTAGKADPRCILQGIFTQKQKNEQKKNYQSFESSPPSQKMTLFIF